MEIDYSTLIIYARDEAKRFHHKYIRTEHLLLALAKHTLLLTGIGVDASCIEKAIGLLRCPTCDADELLELSVSAKRAFELVKQERDSDKVIEYTFLLALIRSSITVKQVLENCGVDMMRLVIELESRSING